MQGFIAGIFAMGVIRFVLTISGLPDDIVKYFSMSVIVGVGTLYFALTTDTHKERQWAAFLLVLPYMVIEVVALGYTWVSGHPTIFHSTLYSRGFSIALHALGHLAGGLTWEPLFVYLLMEIIWGISLLFRRK